MDLKRFTQKDFNLIIEGAKIYDKKLRDKDFLIVFKEMDILKKQSIKYIEVKCRKNNYMHLTGVNILTKVYAIKIKMMIMKSYMPVISISLLCQID